MSGVVGKNSKSLTKQAVTESKLIQQGVSNLRMFHKATKGDTSINLGALSLPSELVSFAGNPSPSVVLSSLTSQQTNNIRVFSSINQELMQNLSWIISGSSINFQNGYTADENEIFEIRIDNRIVNGNTLVDARQLGATGTLAAGQTIFNVGEAYEVGKNIGAQIGAIMVFKDGMLQHRKVGNVASGEGNYIEVPTALNGQYGNTIQFDQAEDIDTNIQVVSVGLLGEKPSVSQIQTIESLAGRIDKLVPTVAQLAGVPETDFQGAPSNVDLKSFGDTVLSQGTRITTLENTPALMNGTIDSTLQPAYQPLADTGNVAGIPASNVYMNWIRVADVVFVTGVLSFTTSSTGTVFIRTPLPVAPSTTNPLPRGTMSTNAAGIDAKGTVQSSVASAATHFLVTGTANSAAPQNMYFSFSYRVR